MKDVRDALMVAHTSDGKLVRRPLSPHLQVYRPQITSILSIMNRITGIATSVGTLLLVWWLVAAATGPGLGVGVVDADDEPERQRHQGDRRQPFRIPVMHARMGRAAAARAPELGSHHVDGHALLHRGHTKKPIAHVSTVAATAAITAAQPLRCVCGRS